MEQLAFDAASQPAKVIFARDMQLPLGTTTLNTGWPLNDYINVNIFPYETDGIITFPQRPGDNILSIEYDFSGTNLRIYNATRVCRVRLIVTAYDNSSPTSGGNKVFRQFTSGGEAVSQILRPGAGANPTLADIVIDSRWPCLQILAEGYITAAQTVKSTVDEFYTGDSYTVNFSNAGGSFPIVKYMTVHNNTLYPDGLCVRPPTARMIRHYFGSADTYYHDGYSTYCELTSATQARFWTHNGNPWNERYTSQNGWIYDYPEDRVTGIRYYIFGIPADLAV